VSRSKCPRRCANTNGDPPNTTATNMPARRSCVMSTASAYAVAALRKIETSR
jgi:hypothetical protein